MASGCVPCTIIAEPLSSTTLYDEVVKRFRMDLDHIKTAPNDVAAPSSSTKFFQDNASYGFKAGFVTKLEDQSFCGDHNSSLMLKVFLPGSEPKKELVLTAAAMKHPNILPIHAVAVEEGRSGNSTCLLVPRPYRTIDELPTPSSIAEFGHRVRQLRQIVEALIHLRDKCKSAHLNLVPYNIFISTNDQGEARLTGIGSKSVQEQTDTKGSSLSFIAPELLLGKINGTSLQENLKSDIFSLGVVMNQVLRIDPSTLWKADVISLFSNAHQFKVELAAQKFTPSSCVLPPFVADNDACVVLRQLVDRCSSFDSAKRPSIDQVLKALKDVENDYEISNRVNLAGLNAADSANQNSQILTLLSNLVNQNSNLQKNIITLQKENATLQTRAQNAEAKLANLETTQTAVVGRVTACENVDTNLAAQQQQIDQRVIVLTGRVNACETKVNGLSTNHQQLDQRVVTVTNDLTTVSGRVTACETVNTNVTATQQQHNQRVTGLERRSNTLLIHRSVDDQELDKIVSSLAAPASISRLQVVEATATSNGKITDAAVKKIVTTLPNLTHLDLTFCGNITNAALQLIRQLVHLEELSFFDNKKISDSGVRHLLLPNLVKLNVDWCNGIIDGGLNDLARLHSLTHLNIRGLYHISDAGIQNLLTGLVNLVELDALGCSQLTDASVQCISTLLPKLESLNLDRWDKITDASLNAIRTGVTQQLKTLNVQGCGNLTDAAKTQLKAALPNLTIN